jgi:hypothetical protein
MSLGPQFHLCVELEPRHFILKLMKGLNQGLIKGELIVHCMLPKIRP